MGLFPFFKKKPFFSEAEQERIVQAIRSCERQTSGEIRVYVESKNYLVSPLERAREVFFGLNMEKTDLRNGVLLYLAVQHKEVALFADEGIYQAKGAAYWDAEVKEMLGAFSQDHLVDGVVGCIEHVGQALKEKFPYIPSEDKNELPDDIVFGK